MFPTVRARSTVAAERARSIPRPLAPGPRPRERSEHAPSPEHPLARAPRRPRGAARAEPFLLMAGASALIALLGTLYLTEANKAAMMTYQINQLQGQQTLLQRDQGDLKLQLDQLQSLQRIQADAAGLGMVPVAPTGVVYLDLPPAVDTVVADPPAARAAR